MSHLGWTSERRHSMKGLVLLVIAVQLTFTQNAYAYLDPGTGSHIFQVVIAMVIGGLFTVRIFWQRIKGFVIRLFSGKSQK